MSMKEQLHEDFGVDLNIRNCEANGTQAAPFYVLDAAVNEGLKTAVTCIRLISSKLGRSWRLATISSVENSEPALVKISVNVILLTEDEYTTETVNYYFHLQGLQGELPKNFNHPVLGLDETTGLIIPLSFGWVQFDTHRLSDPKELGTTYEFSNRFLKAGIYVYDDGHEDIGAGVSVRLSEEFEVAITQVQEIHTDYELWGSPTNEDSFLCQHFFSKTTVSVLGMAGINGKFIKFRLTSPAYPELEESIQSTVGEFQHLTKLAYSNQ